MATDAVGCALVLAVDFCSSACCWLCLSACCWLCLSACCWLCSSACCWLCSSACCWLCSFCLLLALLFSVLFHHRSRSSCSSRCPRTLVAVLLPSRILTTCSLAVVPSVLLFQSHFVVGYDSVARLWLPAASSTQHCALQL